MSSRVTLNVATFSAWLDERKKTLERIKNRGGRDVSLAREQIWTKSIGEKAYKKLEKI
jgi:hypothetical protein